MLGARATVVMTTAFFLGCAHGTSAPPSVAPKSPPAPAAPQAAPSEVPPLIAMVAPLRPTNSVLDSNQLGSRLHPVEANGPSGERDFLMRLQCPDKKAPSFVRNGSLGGSQADGHILDHYTVTCPGGQMTVAVYMDMYHSTREMRPVGSFTVLPELPIRMVGGCPPRVTENADSNARYEFTWRELAKPAALLTPLPDPLTGFGVIGSQQIDFLIDTLGVPDTLTARAGALNAADRFAAAKKVVATLRFSPPEHHPGCLTIQRYGMTLLFK